MSETDFVRHLPGVSTDFARRPSFWQRMHIDLPLLFLLLVLSSFGLVVLYSASGQSMYTVTHQNQFH